MAKDSLMAADDFIIGYERALPKSRPLKNPPGSIAGSAEKCFRLLEVLC